MTLPPSLFLLSFDSAFGRLSDNTERRDCIIGAKCVKKHIFRLPKCNSRDDARNIFKYRWPRLNGPLCITSHSDVIVPCEITRFLTNPSTRSSSKRTEVQRNTEASHRVFLNRNQSNEGGGGVVGNSQG